MGKVRTKTVKKSARVLVEKYYSRLSNDFQTNKKMAAEVAITPSKRMRNKIAGYVTKLMKRIARGPVRGVSLKLQEEERERKLDFIPEVSALMQQEKIAVDADTHAMLVNMGLGDLKRVVTEASGPKQSGQQGGVPGSERRERRERTARA